MTTISVHGASGRLGELIVQTAGAAYIGPCTRAGSVPKCDVVIDVSSPEGLAALIPKLSGQPLVVGTTGDLPWDAVSQYAESAPVVVVANFSVGVPLLIDLIKTAVEALPSEWDIEVVEVHHNAKRDAPSGTAKRLVQAIEEAGGAPPTTHSLRVGDTTGEHTVWLSGPGERIEIKHVATHRSVFAIGAIRWAQWITTRPPGLYKP